MRTEGESRRKLAMALIAIVAVASAWAFMHRGAQRTERERQSPLFQSMPILQKCGLHLNHEIEHMLGEHGSATVPFQQLDKDGQEAVREATRKDYSAKLDTEKITPAEKGKRLETVLAELPNSLIGFQMKAPGNAYVYIPMGSDYIQPPIPLHMVPGTPNVTHAEIELHGHGEAEHGEWEHDHGGQAPPAAGGG